jgi:homogentisate 1,2-dioxygenase
MSEYMGLVSGVYEAKAQGFVPGGGSLHSCMTPHGPDRATFDKASTVKLEPHHIEQAAFMFESTYLFRITDQSRQMVQPDYMKVWDNIPSNFKP